MPLGEAAGEYLDGRGAVVGGKAVVAGGPGHVAYGADQGGVDDRADAEEARWRGYEYRNRASRRMRSAPLAAACRSGWSQMWSHSPGFAGVRRDPSVTASAGHGRW